MSKKLNNTLIASGLVAATALTLAVIVLQYKTKNYNPAALESARMHLNTLISEYKNAYYNAITNSADTLQTNPEYLRLMADIHEISQKMENGEYKTPTEYYNLQTQMDNLLTRADSLEEMLRSEYINKDRKLSDAANRVHMMQEGIKYLKRDSIAADSIKNTPLTTRFNNNFNQMRVDYHNRSITRHIEKLQQVKQQSR